MHRKTLAAVAAFVSTFVASAAEHLPNTEPLTMEGDLSAQMVEGIDRFLMRETKGSVAKREQFWKRDFSSREAYEKSIQSNRERLRKIIGAVDERLPFKALEFIGTTDSPAKIAETKTYEVLAVRWPVFENVFGEGLWLKPKNKSAACVIAVPDADQTPEMLAGLAAGIKPDSQFARRLAESGCEVLIPTLISRDDAFSGNAKLNRFTNQPHREWIYRQSYELGRHVIGYEVQKILAAADYLNAEHGLRNAEQKDQSLLTSAATMKIGIAGYGEGALLSFYAAALDPRIDATLVSGYFDAREKLWSEPIYRNVAGLLREFGDAEIATLIAPRGLTIEYSAAPKIDGPPAPREGRSGAAPGKISTPDYKSVQKEFERARSLLKDGGDTFAKNISLIEGNEGATTGPGSESALAEFLRQLGVAAVVDNNEPATAQAIRPPAERQKRQVAELVDHTQALFRNAENVRADFFWKRMKPDSAENWQQLNVGMKSVFHKEVIGQIEGAPLPLNPRSRKILENDDFTGYDVVLNVQPDVFAWGILLLPKDLKPGERRPVVVCQHGLEGVPMDVVSEDEKLQPFPYYKGFASQLVRRGFVVFAPHNPYRGGDKFRVLQRKANPLGLSLFSFIIAQHQQILNWLGQQPFVDAQRIGFYGLSYGGKTAMRVPAVLDGYALSVCSGDFNEWIHKNVSVDFPRSYMFTPEYEMPEWNLGSTFNYAEMAALIAPRPFMVERGHNDAVGIDEQVSYEYAKVRRLYDQLGIGDRTELEFFNGPHQIHGEGTFHFLHQHLDWPEAK